jgi:tetratricopeptide (TPR) repeat protein
MKLGFILPVCGVLILAGCGGSSASPSATLTATASVAISHLTATSTGVSKTTVPSTGPTGALTPASTGTVGPATPTSSFELGRTLLKAGSYKASEQAFRVSITSKKNVEQSYAGLGSAAFGAADYLAAFQAFKDAWALDPIHVQYTYQIALSALYAGKKFETVSYATRYVRAFPSDGKGYHLLFLGYGAQLDRKDQLAVTQREVTVQPGSAVGWADLGISYGNNGKNPLAEQAFTRAITLDPGIDQFYIDRAIALNLDRKQPAALKDLEKALAITKSPTTRKNVTAAIKSLRRYMATH